MKMVMSKVYKERVGCSYQMIKKNAIVKFKSVSPKRFFSLKICVYVNTGFITFPPSEAL